MLYSVYCDESCHLEHDGINVMTLSAISCPQEKVKQINSRIIEIKRKYNTSSNNEIKWTKISPSKLPMYTDIVDYFLITTTCISDAFLYRTRLSSTIQNISKLMTNGTIKCTLTC